jgi:hypothetical protein
MPTYGGNEPLKGESDKPACRSYRGFGELDANALSIEANDRAFLLDLLTVILERPGHRDFLTGEKKAFGLDIGATLADIFDHAFVQPLKGEEMGPLGTGCSAMTPALFFCGFILIAVSDGFLITHDSPRLGINLSCKSSLRP